MHVSFKQLGLLKLRHQKRFFKAQSTNDFVVFEKDACKSESLQQGCVRDKAILPFTTYLI